MTNWYAKKQAQGGKIDVAHALDTFIKRFSYPAEEGLLIKNLPEHPVHARADRGNAAAYFSFPEIKSLEAHISEIPSGGATPTHRHTCEAFFYVISGSGYSELRTSGEAEKRVEWQAGDLFCTPMGLWHRHVNSDPSRPARYLEITTIPLMKSLGEWRIEAGNDKQSLEQTDAAKKGSTGKSRARRKPRNKSDEARMTNDAEMTKPCASISSSFGFFHSVGM